MSVVTDGVVLVTAEHRRLVTEFENALRPRYDVWTTTSGRQALDIVDNQVDVVVVAPRTTDMDGAKVIARTRERGLEFKAVVVGEPNNTRFDGCVPTPVTEGRIVETVEELTETRVRRVFGKRRFEDGNPVTEDYEGWKEKTVEGFGTGGFAAFNP